LIGFVGARSSPVLAEQIVRSGTGEYGSQGGEQGGSLIKEPNRVGRTIVWPLWEVMAHDLVDAPFTTYPQDVRRFFGAALTGIAGLWSDPAELGPKVSDQMTREQKVIEVLRKAEREAALAVYHEREGRQARRSSFRPASWAAISRRAGGRDDASGFSPQDG